MREKLSARVVFLAVVAAIGGILFGYDTAVISGTTEVVESQFCLSTVFMLTFFLLYVFCTAISISALVVVLLSEMYPNRVRGLAMPIACTFFRFAFMCIPYLLIMYKWEPSTTGKSLEEIEAYWKDK